MTEIQEIVTYLENRVRTSSRNAGIDILKQTEWDAQALLSIAMETIQTYFIRHSIQDPQGQANLTAVSTQIGTILINKIRYKPEEREVWWSDRIVLGDFMIECFYNNHYLDIGKIDIKENKEREFIAISGLPRGLQRSRAPYVIVPMEKWIGLEELTGGYTDMLLGTTTIKPENISELFQPTERPVIKQWDLSREKEFKNLLNRDFIQGLNAIQQTGWRINKVVHNALLKNREKLLDIHKALPLKYASKTIEYNLTMQKADYLLHESEFYQYVECDYRGRVYYTTSFLNYQSNDIAKGQMEFARSTLLTPKGLRWLCIHTATSYNQTYNKNELPDWLETDYKPYLLSEELEDISVDKMTLNDRVNWTSHNLDLVLNTAVLEEIRMEAEKPVTFLACALELNDALIASENGEDFYTRLPIPIDGSNNGWQHLAAISKDKQAGQLVGLVPEDIQKDFYVQTAKALIKRMPEWFEERGMPMKHIRKGIAKRGSMTRAYSAGAEKIAENMYLDCHVEGYTTKYNITEDDCKLLAKGLIQAIDEVCAGPLQTMKFLQKIAETEIASDEAKEQERKAIKWTTPSGFPVEYESYVMLDLKWRGSINCSLRNDAPEDRTRWQIKHVAKEATDKPKIRSFMSGISPNFIHSLDASHMMQVLTNWKLPFGAVHDSFSTYASDVDDLLYLTKKEFIDMYNYTNFFREIEGMILTDSTEFTYQQPQLGELDIFGVHDSDYFFA